jgi:hypothetical protein
MHAGRALHLIATIDVLEGQMTILALERGVQASAHSRDFFLWMMMRQLRYAQDVVTFQKNVQALIAADGGSVSGGRVLGK